MLKKEVNGATLLAIASDDFGEQSISITVED